MKHVDEWLDQAKPHPEEEHYARFVLEQFHWPAWKLIMYRPYIPPLFCTYQGKRYKVTGASVLGDIWLAENFMREVGYDKRVDVTACGEWKAIP